MIECERITPAKQHYFFGYYDKSPWNSSENKILFCQTDIFGRLPKLGEKLKIGYIDLNHNNRPVEFGETLTWNFQQGCMLQWVNDETVIYNIMKKGRYVSCLTNLKGEILKEFSEPIYAISNNKEIAFSVDFSRINQFRQGYGYEGVNFSPQNDSAIKRINLSSGEIKEVLVFSKFKELGFINDSDHYWIDHILFSPRDEKITFLLRSEVEGGGVYSRLFCCNVDGSHLTCLLDTGMASHANWFDDEYFAIWGRNKALVKNIYQHPLFYLVRPIARWLRKRTIPSTVRAKIYGDAFLMINVNNGNIKTFAENIPANEGGGHFTFSKDQRWMLNDTGIDKVGNRDLMLYDLKRNRRINLAKLYTPPEINFTGYRCDLHPRWNPSCNKVCVDSVHEGYRGIYAFDVRQIIEMG